MGCVASFDLGLIADARVGGRGSGGGRHDLIETTRALVKDSTGDVRALSGAGRGYEALGGAAKLSQAKLQRDFHAAALAFQRVQRSSLASTREALESERRTVAHLESPSPQPQPQPQLSLELQQQTEAEAAELEYHESLIAARQAEIREIESGVQELNDIFRDLGNIVHEQGAMIDNIEFNINSVADNSHAAHSELTHAHEYQRKAGRRAACLLLIVGFVVAVVLLAILS